MVLPTSSPPQGGAFSRDLLDQNQNQSPRYSPGLGGGGGGGGAGLQMHDYCISTKQV